MNKKSLWNKFLKTGKVSDYLKYQRAEVTPEDDDDFEPDFDDGVLEIAEEIFPECPNGEDYIYDNEDGRYSNP